MTTTRFDVTAFGESMLRLSAPTGLRLQNMSSLNVHLGGAESNVLAVLAGLERRCGWFGALPTGDIGRYVVRELRTWGIEPNPVFMSGGRLGTYYVEHAAPPRATNVIFDRAHSAITQLDPDQVDYDALLDTRLLHLTGITPALSPSCLSIVSQLVEKARSAEVLVSFDVNFRSTLWPAAEAAATVMPLMQGVELLMCSQRDAAVLFNCHGSVESTIEQLSQHTHASHIVMSLGESGVAGWDGNAVTLQPAVPAEIVDRIGAGDALAGGVIHGWLEGDFVKGLQTGALFAGLALSHHGDMTSVSPEETASLLRASGDNASGAIFR